MKDLILLAKGSTRFTCPFDGGEVWGVNDVGTFPEFKGRHIDRIFTFDPRSSDWLEKARVAPIWSWQPYADQMYPLRGVVDRFFGKDIPLEKAYFTNTISYMLALAIYERFERVRLYGVDAPYGGIYFMEKAGLEYWIGRAQEAGIEVVPCEGSLMLQTYDGLLYGQRGATSIDLYLSDRMYLMNILPREGDFESMYLCHLAKWLLALKVTERDKYEVEVGNDPKGNILYKVKREFLSKVHFPYWVITYLRNILQNIERQGKLPMHLTSIYGVVCSLSQSERDGPYITERRVSYVLATKNRAKFMERALENAKQLKTDIDELIVVDGNSLDDTREIIANYRPIIDKLLVGDDKNVAHALNKGFMTATGRYVKQLCDDDLIDPGEMNRAVKYMDEHPEIDLLVCGGIKETPQGKVLTTAPPAYGQNVADIFQYGSCGTGFIHRRDSFARFGLINTDYVAIDREFALRLIANGGVVRFFPGRHYLHGVHSESTSIIGLDKWNSDNEKLKQKYLAPPSPPVLPEIVKTPC